MAEKAQETTKDSEAKASITVICNTSREDGKGKKPQGIHLNPKFLNPTSRNHGPPRHPLPPPNHDLRMSFSQGPSHGFRAFPPRYPHAYGPNEPPHHGAPFRPNFAPLFQGPRHRGQFFPHQFPPPPRFDWQGGPPGFQQGYSHPPPPTSFSNEFSSEYIDNSTNQRLHPHPTEFQHQYDFSQPPPPIPWQAEKDPVPGPSYYQGFRDEYNHGHTHPANNQWNSGERKYSRSRSRSPSSRRHRSLSRSSGRRSYESGERRSSSLSSHSTKRKRRSYDTSSENDDLWDSDVERNSDSDLDLSKPLDSFTSNVSDSKSLLKGALKCLGSAKIETMIPTELNNISRNKLFQMCAELLDETENEELIHIMEGKTPIKKVQSMNNTSHSVMSTSSSSESDVNTRQKSQKKKRSKKKKKKRKKGRVSQSEDDFLETETGHEEDSSSSENGIDNLDGVVDGTLSDVNKSKSRPSSGTSQQSLLELIQIEYKTKAINVMLKNLGVATEISSLVSNVLHTSGISAIQAVAATETIKQEEDKAESSKAHNVDNVVPNMNLDAIETDVLSVKGDEKGASISDSDSDEDNCQSVSDSVPENEIIESQNKDCSNTNTCSTFTASPSKPKNDTLLFEKEMFKEVLDDVLDIGVGDNEEIDFY